MEIALRVSKGEERALVESVEYGGLNRNGEIKGFKGEEIQSSALRAMCIRAKHKKQVLMFGDANLISAIHAAKISFAC